MNSYAVEVSNLHKHFGKVQALRGLSVQIERGITYGLLGPNGAGKTTLIRSIVGLLPPEAGAVRVLGSLMPDKRVMGRIGYMTQDVALYEDLTVRQNVAFFAAMAGVRIDAQRINEVLALVELSDRLNSRVRELSGGLQRRCSLACALVHRPDLVVLDEPTVGVDPQLRVQFWDHFRRLNAEGVTLVVSSHVMDEAARCDRLGFIRDGRLLAEGTDRELLARSGCATLEDAFLHFAEQVAIPG
ncbi:MAG: ABC transporter ATP-binding protein [Chloroflexi bacterium]|nr:ABC transporter ATP-binding protein [Chloroflexota bacterium]